MYLTRAERAANAAARLKARREAVNKELSQAEARVRAVERADRRKRHLLIGKLADEAQLLRWSDEDLASLFHTLGSALAELEPSNPGPWLQRLVQGAKAGKAPRVAVTSEAVVEEAEVG
jgi:hypothetical protein